MKNIINNKEIKILQNSILLIIYSIDSFISFFFIIWFAFEWLINEDVKIEIKPNEDYSKSASQNYEYSWILITSFVVIFSRIYFNLILLSFYKKLIRFYKIQGLDESNILQNGDEVDLKNKNFFQKWNYKLQVLCFKYLQDKV